MKPVLCPKPHHQNFPMVGGELCLPCTVNRFGVLGSTDTVAAATILREVNTMLLPELCRELRGTGSIVVKSFTRNVAKCWDYGDLQISTGASNVLYSLTHSGRPDDAGWAGVVTQELLGIISNTNNLLRTLPALNLIGKILHAFPQLARAFFDESGTVGCIMIQRALQHPSVLVRASAYFVLLQDGSDVLLTAQRGAVLRSVAETLPNNTAEAVPAIENAVGVLSKMYSSGTATTITALVAPTLLEGLKAVLMHHNPKLVAYGLGYLALAKRLDPRPLVRAGFFDLAAEVLGGATSEECAGVLEALNFLRRLPNAAAAGFQPHRALEPTVRTVLQLLHNGGSTVTLIVGFEVLAECLKQPLPRSLYHMVGLAFDAVIECASKRADGAGYSDLFSVACAVGVQLLRPGLATETLADDWAVAVGNTWSAVVDRLDAKSGTVVGRSRHATMLIAALDLLNRGAQLVAHSSVSAARNGFGDVAMFSAPPAEQAASLLDAMLSTHTTRVLRIALAGGGKTSAAEGAEAAGDIPLPIFAALSRYLSTLLSISSTAEYGLADKLARYGFVALATRQACRAYPTQPPRHSGHRNQDADDIAATSTGDSTHLASIHHLVAQICLEVIPVSIFRGMSTEMVLSRLSTGFGRCRFDVPGLLPCLGERVYEEAGGEEWETPQAVCLVGLVCALLYAPSMGMPRSSELRQWCTRFVITNPLISPDGAGHKPPASLIALAVLTNSLLESAPHDLPRCSPYSDALNADGSNGDTVACNAVFVRAALLFDPDSSCLPFGVAAFHYWLMTSARLSLRFPRALELELRELFPGENHEQWRAVDIAIVGADFAAAVAQAEGVAALARIVTGDVAKESAQITKAALLLEFLTRRQRRDSPMLPEGCGEIVREAAMALLLSVNSQLSELPRVQMIFCACSVMLSAAQATLALPGDLSSTVSSTVRTICTLSIQWAAQDGPRQVCRKQCLAFVIQTLEVSIHRSLIKTVLAESESTGLFHRLIGEIERSVNPSDTRQVSLAFVGALVSAELAIAQAATAIELPIPTGSPPSIAIEHLVQLVHGGAPSEKVSVCNLLTSIFALRNRSSIVHITDLSAAPRESSTAPQTWLGDLFLGLQNQIAVSTEQAQAAACACAGTSLTFASEERHNQAVAAILRQRWTWLMVRCAFSSGTTVASRCWHIFDLVTTLVHHGGDLQLLCDPVDFHSLARQCILAATDRKLPVSKAFAARVAALIAAAEGQASQDEPRCRQHWLAAVEALEALTLTISSDGRQQVEDAGEASVF